MHLLSREELLDLLQRGEIKQALMAAPLWKYFYSIATASPAEKP